MVLPRPLPSPHPPSLQPLPTPRPRLGMAWIPPEILDGLENDHDRGRDAALVLGGMLADLDLSDEHILD